MDCNNKTVKQRIVPFVISSLLPLAVILIGILQLFSGEIFTLCFAINYVIIPICLILLMLIVNFSKSRMWIKIVLNITITIIFAIIFLVIFSLGHFERLVYYKNTDVAENYNDISDNMPTLSEIGQPENIEYYDYFSIGMIFFDIYSDTLICEYSEADYINQKNQLEEKYIFQTYPMTADEYSCPPEIEIDGYTFRALSIEEYEMYYPKGITFIATNDQTNEIVYLSFYDDDLDYIVSLEDFIYNECGWKHIR